MNGIALTCPACEKELTATLVCRGCMSRFIECAGVPILIRGTRISRRELPSAEFAADIVQCSNPSAPENAVAALRDAFANVFEFADNTIKAESAQFISRL